MDEKARKQDLRPESGFRKRPAVYYALRLRTGEVPLTKPETTIGRSASSDIVLESALVSRRHARLLLSDSGPFLEDLGSRNGIIVNSVPVRGSARLSVGDRIRIGPEILELIELAPPATSVRDTVRQDTTPDLLSDPRATGTAPETLAGAASQTAGADDGEEDATDHADILELLANQLERALGSGRIEDAERMMSGHLVARLEEARRGSELSPALAARAATFAVRLAAASEKSSWLDYVISLFSALERPLPLTVVDEMSSLIGRLGINRGELRKYVALLRTSAGCFTPEERFALQRVEGLERLAAIGPELK